jgi:hypothetical protein
MVEAPTRWPSVSNSPWILCYFPLRFSRALRWISTDTVSLRGGRPRWWGEVPFVVTRRRGQRGIVPGVTRRCLHSMGGSLRTSAAKAHSIRSIQAGLGVDFARHGDVVTHHQELNVLRRRRAGEQQQQVHQLKKDQVKETQRHGSRSALAAEYTDHPGHRRRPTSETPQGWG